MSDGLVPPTPTEPSSAPVSPTTPTSPTTPSSPTTPTTPTFSYTEEQYKADQQRFKAAERATNLAAQERDRYRADLDAEKRRVAALAGVTPKTPEAEESERIREAFFKLQGFEHFRGLTPEKLQKLDAMLEQSGQLVTAHQQQLETMAVTMLSDVVGKVSESVGYDLSPRQAVRVEAVFKDYMNHLRQTEGEQQTEARYLRRDPTLIANFLKEYEEDFVKPNQRQGYVATARQCEIRVPRSGPGQPVVTQSKKIDFSKFGSVEEMAAAAEEEGTARMKAGGLLRER